MTQIPFEDGKVVMRGGQVGTGQACCCKCPDECRVYYTLNVQQEANVHIFFPHPDWNPDNPLDPYRPLDCTVADVNQVPNIVSHIDQMTRCPDNPECQFPQEQYFCNFPEIPQAPFPDECSCGDTDVTFVRLSCECLAELAAIAEEDPSYIPLYYVDGQTDEFVPVDYIVVPCELFEGEDAFDICEGLPP